jgi:hypothetical protein
VGFMDRMKGKMEQATAGAMEKAQAATSSMGVGASPEQIELANRAKKLRDQGIDRPAHIDSMTATGNTDTPGGTEYNITLTISPVGGEPYETTINQYIYPSNPFTDGENVTVKCDPDDLTVAMIFGHA